MSNLNTGSGPGPAPSDLPKPPSRHQVKRSLTEFASPARPQRHHHHHLPLHHFHHHHHRHLQHLRQHDGREAPLQLRHSLDMIRSTGPASATLSPGQSRRASLSAPRDDGRDMDEAREARLRREQAKASIRADILKQSLVDLNAFSTTMTRQLDETYYAVLEKMSRLQSTVTAIQGLAESLRETCDGFERDSHALESDTLRQVASLGHFDQQEAQIAGLQGRITRGRDRIQTLTDRVDLVRGRIESWERADRAWQERTRKRLKITWSVTSVVALLVIALAVGVNYTARELAPADAAAPARAWLAAANRTPPEPDEPDGRTTGPKVWTARPPHEDERLRALDEL